MTDHIYRITLTTVGRNGVNNFMNFATHHETMSALAHELRENGFIVGERLFTRRDPDGTHVVHDRSPTLVGKPFIGRIDIPNHGFVQITEE